MDGISATQILASLMPEKKARLMAMLCHNLTILARDTYGEGIEVKSPRRLRTLNEIQHRMTGFLASILESDDCGSLDDPIVRVFFGDRDDKELQRLLESAFERVSRSFGEQSP
jgi:hypothetical protein